jgi:flagellum-specific peptidoglycan hydrolase FlgJ
MKKGAAAKTWTKMTPKELPEATDRFDDPNYAPPAVRMPAQLRKRHEKALSALRAKSRTNAAKFDNHGARVQITLRKELLRRADELAQQHGLSRSQIIAQGLELLIAG